MKKIVLMACALLIGSFAVQAQEDSDVAGTTTTTTKAAVQKEAPAVQDKAPTAKTQDELNPQRADAPQTDIKKVLEDRERRAAKIRAEKKKENQALLVNKKTGTTTSKARVVTKEMLEAEKIEKQKKATQKDN